MTGKLGSLATSSVIQRLIAPSGMNSSLGALTEPDNLLASPLDSSHIRAQNVAAELAERSGSLKYPSLNIYCEKIANRQTEKFRSFSGDMQMAVEVRHSQDRLDGMGNALELYVDSVAQVLSQSLGDWGSGFFYAGGYEVALGPVKTGGKNFIQTAKISFQLDVSRK